MLGLAAFFSNWRPRGIESILVLGGFSFELASLKAS